jgi:hypothetical protein
MSDSSDSDFEMVPALVLKRRAACERWKTRNRDYYLEQKRRLASRPEYLQHRREMYKARVDELKELGILPRRQGRPRMYTGPEAIEMKRQRTREAMARYRMREQNISAPRKESS